MKETKEPLSQLHGGEVEWAVSKRYNIPLDKIISFASTVSPIVPDSIRHANIANNAHLYPPADYSGLKSTIAKYQDLDDELSISVGCGSTELIHLFAQSMSSGEILIPVPTYGEYEYAVKRNGGRPVIVGGKNDFSLDLEAIKRSVSQRTKAIMICNPNNPTGRLFDRHDADELATFARDKEIILVVDEAYSCFVSPERRYSAAKLAKSYPIIVLNSISKLFGVPSVRLGWAIASPPLIEALERHKIPWTVSNFAIWAGQTLLQDTSYQRETIRLLSDQKRELTSALHSIPWLKVFPSETNFLLVRILETGMTSTDLFDKLVSKGIVIRDCTMMKGLGNNFFRITVRTPTQNSLLVSELRKMHQPLLSSKVGAN